MHNGNGKDTASKVVKIDLESSLHESDSNNNSSIMEVIGGSLVPKELQTFEELKERNIRERFKQMDGISGERFD